MLNIHRTFIRGKKTKETEKEEMTTIANCISMLFLNTFIVT